MKESKTENKTVNSSNNLNSEQIENRINLERVLSICANLFKEIKYGLLQVFVGRNARICVQTALKEQKNLSVFKPSNEIEAVLKDPSYIWEHLATLHMLTVELNLKTVLELGTAEGKSTVVFLYAARQLGGRTFSIDIDPCKEAQAIIKKHALDDRWTFICDNDLQVAWNQTIDHLFIDTSHEYEHTLRELQKYEPYVRDGGIITLHDIVSFPDVMVAITEYLTNRNDLRLYKYLHNNGLAVIFKGHN